MFVSPVELQHQKLKGRLRSYDRQDVDHLLEKVAASYEEVWYERDRLRARVEELEAELAEYKQLERELRDTMVTAQRAGEEIRAEAERERESAREEAKAEAKRIVAKAAAERDRVAAEVERLQALEEDLQASYRAFLLAALELLENGGRQAAEPAPLGKLPESVKAKGADKKAEEAPDAS